MNMLANELPWIVVRANLLLLATGFVSLLVLRLARPQSAKIHRMVWAVVLFQGLMIPPIAIKLAWLPAAQLTSSAMPTDDATPDFALLPAATLPAVEANQTGHEAAPSTVFNSTTAAASVRTAWSYLAALGLIWMIGMIACTVIATLRYRWFLRTVGNSRPAPEAWQNEWTQLLAGEGISRKIEIRVHDEVGPLLCVTPSGYQVVVPSELWTSLSAVERETVLRHELAHYRRRDVWLSLLARVIALPHWFNPMVWYAARKFDEAAEWACDEQLASIAPRHVPSYARVLLQLVESDSPPLGISAAGGASLSQRIRRLLAGARRESLFGRAAVCMTLATVVGLGAVRFELVENRANAQDEISEEEDRNAVLTNQLVAVAKRIDPQGNPLVTKFKAALQTETGQLVARDQIGWIEERLRNQARDQAIPDYLQKNFSADANTEFRQRFVANVQQYNKDIAQISTALKKIAERIPDDSEEHKLMRRFLQHEAASSVIYFQQLRKLLRPDVEAVAERLAEIFVHVGGRYRVRTGTRDEAIRIAERATRALRAYRMLSDDIPDFAKEIADSPELTKQFKSLLQRPAMLAMVAFEVSEDDDSSITVRIDEFFEQLEHITVDAADGLVVREEAEEEVRERMEHVRRIEATAGRLQAAVVDFAHQVAETDDLHKQLKVFLSSELAVMRIADDYELSDASPEQAVKALISEGLEKGPNGVMRLRDDVADEFVEHVREALRQYRTIMRKAKAVDRFAERLVDNRELTSAIRSTAGKLVIATDIQRQYATRNFDGINVWVEENFEERDGGYVCLGDDVDERLRDFLQQVKDVEEELKHDDF